MSKKIFLLVVSCFLTFADANAEGFRQEMDVSIGVFDAAKLVLDYEKKQEKYNIGAEVKTANFFNSLYPFIGKYISEGKIVKDKVVPELYNVYTESKKNVRTKKIFYDENGVAYKRISTKNNWTNVVEIKDVPKTANASDLQTVFAELIGKFYKTKSCVLEREVYDGKKHYKVIVRDEGTENRYFDLTKRTENSYKCSVYIENLEDNNDNILWDMSAEKPILFWIGVDIVAKMPFVYEIRIDSTPLGALRVLPKTLEIK